MTFAFYILIECIALFCFSYANNNGIVKVRNRFSRLAIIISFVLLAGIVALRDESVGRDTLSYIRAIERVQNNTLTVLDRDWLPIGFRLLIRLLSYTRIPGEYIAHFIFGICAVVTLYCFYRIFWEMSDYPTVSLYIFFSFCLYFQMMNQFRQMLAVSVTFLAYRYLNKSFIKFAVLIILASCFHTSAIIMFPCYFISKWKISKNIIMFYFIAAVVALFSFSLIVRILKKYTNSGAVYLGWEVYDVSFTTSSIINLIVRILLLLISLKVYKPLIKKDKNNNTLYHMIIICTILQLFAVISYIFGRITTYFFLYYIILLPKVFQEYKRYFTKDSSLIYKILIVFLLFVYQSVYYFSQGAVGGGYDKYTTFF